jgi:hypothetical protein
MNEPELYFNTTSLEGQELSDARFKAGMLNSKVLSYMKAHKYDNVTRFELWKRLGINNHPETSIGRALTNLTDMGELVKLDGKNGNPKVQRKGRYGSPCYAWCLNREK